MQIRVWTSVVCFASDVQLDFSRISSFLSAISQLKTFLFRSCYSLHWLTSYILILIVQCPCNSLTVTASLKSCSFIHSFIHSFITGDFNSLPANLSKFSVVPGITVFRLDSFS